MKAARTLAVVIALPAIDLGSIAQAHAQSAASTSAPAAVSGSAQSGAQTDREDSWWIGSPRDLRTAPRAPSLPDLIHRPAEILVDQTLSSFVPADAGSAGGGRLSTFVLSIEAELAVRPWLYVGASWSLAAARSVALPEATPLLAEPLLFARAVHPISNERFALGAGFGVIPGLGSYDGMDDGTRIRTAQASAIAGVLRPWDLSSWLDHRVTFRPWVDLRAASRSFAVQFRQAIDVAARWDDALSPAGPTGSLAPGYFEAMTISTLFLGVQPTREVSLGVEIWETYLLKTSFALRDQQRSVLAIAPSVRFFYRWVEPAISIVLPVGSPLLEGVDSYFGARLDLRIWLGDPAL
jgi:hypothetical protein